MKNYSEELYVSTDREVYFAGEQVFFKVFCLNRLTHRPSAISKVAYVSLLDENNIPLLQVKTGIDSFSGSGQIVLPGTIRTGNYYLSTCTHWMQNFSPDLFSYKKISVINPYQRVNRIKIPSGESVPFFVEFFPESGSIIRGKMTLVGFKCLDKNNFPIEVKGFISDSENNILCNINSDRYGYGFFSINPSDTGKLYLVTRNENSVRHRFELPPVIESGISIHLTTDRNQQVFRINVLRSDGFTIADKEFFLVYSPVSFSPFSEEINLFIDKHINLSKSTLPSGLATLTIIDDSGVEYAKRWIYNDKSDLIYYGINKEKNSYQPREKVKVEISATDNDGKPLQSDLVVSVVKSFTSVKKSDLIQESVQLPGMISAENDSLFSDVNNQLIFYKGKTGLPKAVSQDTLPEYLPEPDGHIVSGKIKSGITNEPLINENITFSIVGRKARCSFTTTDNYGRFTFITREPGTHEIVIVPLSEEFENYYVELDNPYPLSFSKLTPERFYVDTTMLSDINDAIISCQVRNIYEPFIMAEKEKVSDALVTDFYGKADYTTQISKYIELTSLKEVFKEIVPGVYTVTKKNRSYINLIIDGTVMAEDANPLVIVDGVPVINHERVLRIPPNRVEQIDVMSSKYFVASVTINGIVDITTTKGNLNDIDFNKPLFRQEFESLQHKPVFITPEYYSQSQKESRLPDFRNTLYWNGDLKTDATGKVFVEFFASDEEGNYVISVEGFTSNGAKGRSATEMTVNKL